MKVIEVNDGEKVQYKVSKNKITFEDELMLNVEKLERDIPVCVDICVNRYGMLTNGLGVKYVAQIEIPARKYKVTEFKNPDYVPGGPTVEEKIVEKESIPFSIENVTLKLYKK